jgi:DNA-binding IclR family transcriptional regulator
MSSAAETKVPALQKALAIIRYINQGPLSGRPLSEIMSKLDITKSHCHNILKTLVDEHWLGYDSATRCYSLTPAMLNDVSQIVAGRSRSASIHDELVKLCRVTKTPSVLTRVERDGSFVVIDKADHVAELLTYSAPVGHRFARDTAAQMRVRMAWLSPDRLKHELMLWKPVKYTNTTITRKSALLAELELTRKRGYAISRAEVLPGVMTFAAPVYDAFGDVEMVLQCPGVSEIIAAREDEIVPPLLRTCRTISDLITGRSSDRAA